MFNDDVQLAVIGEFVVCNALLEMRGTRQVHDVRYDKRFQEWDVDFLVEDANRQFTWLEVKTDWKTFTTGNVIFETESNGNPGCLERTKADYVAYFVPQSGNIYMCNTEALRRCVRKFDYPVRPMGDNARGMIVPLGDLERLGVVQKMIKTTPLQIERKQHDERERIDY